MGIDKDATSILPKDGYGYIYVLSSPSISGVHKVGMTTKCVSERIKELNSTGVPQSFIAERIFEVEVIHLKEIEKLAHKKLKTKGFHYGKEFFQASIEECDLAINYAINLISKTNGIELIKKKRDEIDQKKKEGELIDKEIDILLRKYLFLEWVNRDIYRKAMSKRENLQIVNTQGQNGLLTLLKIACAITLIAIGPVGWGIGIFLLWASSKQPKPPAISYPQIHFLGEELFSVLDIARGVDEYNISENDLGDKCVTFIERLDEENSINWEYGVKESRAALYCRSNPLIMSEDFKVSTFFSDKDMTDMGFYSKYTKLHKKEYIYVAVPMNKENDEYGDNNSFFLINLADKNARDNLSQRI